MKFNNRKVTFLLFFILVVVNSFAYINISPTTLDKNIKVGAYEEFSLFNDTTIPFRYKITPVAMTENKKFKVYIKADKNAPEGDYGTFLNIRQMSAPKLKGQATESIGAGMVVMVNLNMGIYGYVGDEVPTVEVVEKPQIYKKDGKSFLKMKLANKTNRLARIKVEIEGKRKYFYPIGESRVFKGETLVYDNEIKNLGDSKASKIIISDTETKKVLKEIKLK